MSFTEFLKLLSPQNDLLVNSFLTWAKTQRDFPASSNPEILAKALYLKLNHQMTLGFQKCLMMYFEMENNELPAGLKKDQQKMLKTINFIVSLQDGDNKYKNF